MKNLGLVNNEITNIAPLSQLVNLEKLYLANNQLTNIAPLVRNSGLSEGDFIGLMGNPLSGRSIGFYISKLELRGVEVNW